MVKAMNRCESTIGNVVKQVADEELKYCLKEEIKLTLNLVDDSDDAFQRWMSLPLSDRDEVGITVSYDMTWQKRSSGRKYDSPSGHSFIVGQHSRCIVMATIFSKVCKKMRM